MSRELLKRVIAECGDEGSRSNITTGLYSAIIEYLEQPEPEPVVWINNDDLDFLKQSRSYKTALLFSSQVGVQIPLYTAPPDQSARIAELEALNADLLRQLSNYHVGWESQEDLLEQLYWEFDADRKKQPENERIRFKGKLRFFADQVNQSKQPTA